MSILRQIRAAAVIIVGLGLVSCGSTANPTSVADQSARTITVQTNTGEVVVPVNPQRVVALDNTSFTTLQAWGITPVAAPKQLLPESLAAWANDPQIIDVGTHREPKLEQINAAEPDLIIGGKRFIEYTQTLSAIAPVLDLAPNVEQPDYVAALKNQTTALGEIFDRPDDAAQLNAELDAAVAAASSLTTGQSVFLANHNGGKIDNGAGRMAPLIEPLNLVDVFASNRGGSDSVHNDSGLAPETVAQANPDWVFVLDRDAAVNGGTPARATIEAQELWRNTTFATKSQVLYLDPDFYYTEGITTYTAFYRQLAEALQDAA